MRQGRMRYAQRLLYKDSVYGMHIFNIGFLHFKEYNNNLTSNFPVIRRELSESAVCSTSALLPLLFPYHSCCFASPLRPHLFFI